MKLSDVSAIKVGALAVAAIYCGSTLAWSSTPPVTAIENPRYALVGDSLTMYGNAGVTISSANTLTRDAAGLVTAVTAAHGLAFPGTQRLSMINLQDKTFEVLALATIVNATTFTYQTSVIGSPATTSGDVSGFGRALILNQNVQNGYWDWFNSFCLGGARNRGNFGQGADRLDQMSDATTKACQTDADVINLEGGINDINGGGADGPTVIARMQALVNIVKAAGKKYHIIGITPLGSLFNSEAKNTAIQAANAGYAAIAASDPGIGVFSSAYNDLTDGTLFGQAYSWVTSDSVHWGERAAYWVGYRKYLAEQSRITLGNLLPTTSTDTPTLNGYTLIKQYGAWSATGGGFAGTGVTGTVAPNLQIFSSATLPAVASLVDRGGTDGFFQQLVSTPSAASQQILVYLGPNGGQTLAALGLAVGDTVKLVAEVVVSNGLTSSLVGVTLTSQSQSSGTLGKTIDGVFLGQAGAADNYTRICVAEEWIIGSSVTSIINLLAMRFGTTLGNACTVSIGKAALYKKTGTI